jgi:Tol biopolymer transport system component
MIRSKRLKIILAGLASLVILAILALGIRNGLIGAQIAATYPGDDGDIGATGKAGIRFAQPMHTHEVEQRIHIHPDISGDFAWDGNTIWFTPRAPWSQGVTYTLRLDAGATSLDGRKVLKQRAIQFRIRQPDILYLSTSGSHLSLWSISSDGGTAHPLTPSGQSVYDFAPSCDGEQVVYSATNAQNGMDLWLVRRDGTRNRRLIDCGADQCSQPAWSPDGNHIVFYRQMASQSNSPALTGVWSVNSQSGDTAYLFPGSHPSISPDGKQLVLLEPVDGVIRVLDVQTGKGVEVQADTDILPAWFPDSSRMAFARTQTDGESARVELFQLDIKTRQATPLLATPSLQATGAEENLDTPAISQDAQRMVIGMHGFGEISSQQLWMMDIGGGHSQQITHDPVFSNTSYSWDPWGNRLLFQQLELGVSAASPQVMVWDRQTGQMRQIAAQATLPAWLP